MNKNSKTSLSKIFQFDFVKVYTEFINNFSGIYTLAIKKTQAWKNFAIQMNGLSQTLLCQNIIFYCLLENKKKNTKCLFAQNSKQGKIAYNPNLITNTVKYLIL